MNTTQDYLPIKDIRDDLVILKDGSVTSVIKTSAVNFGLLSENEQLAIISSFAGLLNSLSFSIQIMIRSKRLDISSYLQKLDEAQSKQKNPLLADIMGRYRIFIESVIRENEVLDKQFYIAISVSSLELGIINDIEKHFQKALTTLIPRRDHVVRQLERIGLRATQLNTENLARLFYDIFNEIEQDGQESQVEQATQSPVVQNDLEKPGTTQVTSKSENPVNRNPDILSHSDLPTTPLHPQVPTPQISTLPPTSNLQPLTSNRMPFIVEELPDEYSSV